MLLLLAAVWLYPKVQTGEVAVSGNEVMGVIATIFTESVGPWMMTIFIAGAFAATFTTAFNYFDGWPRVVGACSRNLFRKTARLQGIAKDSIGDEHRRTWYSEYNIYRLTMIYSLVASVLIIVFFGKSPVWLVLIASALAYFISPVIFFLNFYYCLKVIPKTDKNFYPSPFARWFTWLSLIVFTGMVVILINERIVDRIFGG